jgi:hypothetical protein
VVKGKAPRRETSEDSGTATAGPGVNLVASSTSIGDSGTATAGPGVNLVASCTSIGDSGTALFSYLSDGTKP